MKRFLFIYNPQTRGGNSKAQFEKLKIKAREKLGECVFLTSARKGDIAQIAEDGADSFQVIVACGGDGTVSEVVTGITHTEAQLGIVPLGSGNDFATSLGITSNIKKAVEILKKGRVQLLDVGKCNDQLFANTLGFGFDGLTNKIASESRLSNGTFRYILAALKANTSHKIFKAEIYQSEKMTRRELIMITIANGRREGGHFRIAPEASLNDGKLDLVTLAPISRKLLPFYLPLFVFGRHLNLDFVSCEKTDKCRIIFDQHVPIHMDGEIYNTDATEFNISILPSQVPTLIK